MREKNTKKLFPFHLRFSSTYIHPHTVCVSFSLFFRLGIDFDRKTPPRVLRAGIYARPHINWFFARRRRRRCKAAQVSRFMGRYLISKQGLSGDCNIQARLTAAAARRWQANWANRFAYTALGEVSGLKKPLALQTAGPRPLLCVYSPSEAISSKVCRAHKNGAS